MVSLLCKKIINDNTQPAVSVCNKKHTPVAIPTLA